VHKQPFLLNVMVPCSDCINGTGKILQLLAQLNPRSCICSLGGVFKWKEIVSVYADSEKEQKEKEMEICVPFTSMF